MSDCESHRESILEAALAGKPVEGDSDLAHHLSHCPNCRSLRDESEFVAAAYVEHGFDAPQESYWPGFVDRLEARVVDRAAGRASSARVGHRLARLQPAFRIGLAASIAAILFVLGIMVGRATMEDRPADPAVSRTSTPVPASVSVTQYLTRVQTLFLGLSHADPSRLGSLAANRRAAERLLADASGLRGQIDDAGDPMLSNLLEDVELVLLQIANADPEQAAVVGHSLEELALPLRVNLYLIDADTRPRVQPT